MNPEFLVPLIPIVAIIAVAAVKVARLRATRPESPSIDVTARFEANRQEASLVVRSHSRGLFLKRWCYLTPYRGLTFFTLSPEALPLPGKAEVIEARAIWIP